MKENIHSATVKERLVLSSTARPVLSYNISKSTPDHFRGQRARSADRSELVDRHRVADLLQRRERLSR